MDGANVDPNGLELNWRISRRILTKILDDKTFDVKSLKLPLENYIEELKNDSDDEDNDADMDPNDDNEEEDDWDVFDSIPEEFSFEEVGLVEEAAGFDEEGEEITQFVPRLIETMKEDETEGLIWVSLL